ncbi:MAG: hypothetical protein K8T10_11375 [Candidatus Eremiobacteraeota bacterium]|nr:hypothetical protein [Candidatus Eremiobacteraeota bacterium]
MPEYTKPELKPVAEKMISRVHGICETGSGSIPLSDILGLFPGIPSDIADQIGDRGDIDFSGGNLENTGDEKDIKFDVAGKHLKVIIPPQMKGKYECLSNRFRLSFEHDYTIRGCAKILWGWVCTNLKKIDVSDERIFIDFDNEMADVTIKFE